MVQEVQSYIQNTLLTFKMCFPKCHIKQIRDKLSNIQCYRGFLFCSMLSKLFEKHSNNICTFMGDAYQIYIS